MESHAQYLKWLHDCGYTFHDLPGLTYPEVSAVLLGSVVEAEQERDAIDAELGGGVSASERQKRQHKQSIRRRLRREEHG